jgi:hypothetical protein
VRALALTVLLLPAAAVAADGGCENVDCVPTACDGGLCATSNGSGCGLTSRGDGGGSTAAPVFGAAFLLMLLAARRRAAFAALAVTLTPLGARAETDPGAVDVRIAPAPVPRRWLSVEWNPLPLFTLSKASLNVAFAPAEHHALTLSPFYSWAQTEPVYLLDAQGNPTVRLPHQTFDGFGAELGYRYYSGAGGLRGFFAGPSLITAHFVAGAENGEQVPFWDFGIAVDAGWQMLIADHLLLSAGAGVQYLFQDRTIPPQSFPARLYANGGVLPRVLLSIGWAF